MDQMQFINIQLDYEESQTDYIKNRGSRAEEANDKDHEKTLCVVIAEVKVYRLEVLVVVVLNQPLFFVLLSAQVLFETGNAKQE